MPISVLSALLVFGASCASTNDPNPSPPPVGDATGAVDLKQAHNLEQLAVAECMKEHGFDYVIPSFDVASTDPWHFLLLREADTFGYQGTYTSLVYLTPGGGPPPDLTRQEMDAYDLALTGRIALEEPSNGIRWAGCQAVGKQARARLNILAENHVEAEEIGDAFARVRATSEYIALADEWSDCLVSEGFTAPSSDPVDHARIMRDQYWQRATDRLIEIFSPGADPGVFEQQTSSNMVLDKEWFDSLLAADDTLSELFDEERELALADQACRAPLAKVLAAD